MELKKINDMTWEILKEGKMNVPGRIFASDKLLEKIKGDNTIEQTKNVAALPGIYKYSIALPDCHQGYGFPIGGVAALDYEEGGLSPGGIGFDINCGVRLVRTNLTFNDVKPHLKELLDALFKNIPSGVGKSGKIRLSKEELLEPLAKGVKWAVEQGYAWEEDLKFLEENGNMPADTDTVSEKALKRGKEQIGTTGAGNHFVEIQLVDDIFDENVAKAFGLSKGQICVMIHTGSRGFGHQVCTDYLREMENKFRDTISKLPDRELIYAPAGTDTCAEYYEAMKCAANFAFCNRQLITHWTREAFQKVIGQSAEDLGMHIVYGVCHNIGKVEKYEINGETKKVYVHRKGATRSFPPGHKDVPAVYRDVGQPVLIPGSMGTASYVLHGTQDAMNLTFGSTAHGAGRVASRSQMLRTTRGEKVKEDLAKQNILVRSASWKVLAEEAPKAYKDIDEVVRVSDALGIAKLVAKLVPLAVMKG